MWVYSSSPNAGANEDVKAAHQIAREIATRMEKIRSDDLQIDSRLWHSAQRSFLSILHWRVS